MVAFNWSHARAGSAETQLELCQAGSQRTGNTKERQLKQQMVLCFVSG